MRFLEFIVTTTTYVVRLFSSSTFDDLEVSPQIPLFDYNAPLTGGPVFKPPTGRRRDLPGGDLVCNYTLMGPDWTNCSTPENRQCWLRNIKTGQQFNISTDYEDPKNVPTGIDRYYNISASDGWINADGQNFTQGKFFWDLTNLSTWEPENRYPGPWIQACWGDTVHINVYNNLTFNGTSVHWHGIRQWKTFWADGVPGVTQCPIAPTDNLTYTFRIRQYGSSWYHSHFSLQYADGAAGPMTLHGPTSGNWDEPKFPIMMTDWGHNSAFLGIWGPPSPGLGPQSTLLNGVGNVTRFNNKQLNTTEIPQPYDLRLNSTRINGRPRRYLLRLINISFESMFVFSIDSHILTVMTTDFVAIRPYNTTNIRIGIGQRYTAVLTAQPVGSTARSFWMRTYRPQCFNANNDVVPDKGYEKAGVVYYDDETVKPAENLRGWTVDSVSCSDEPYDDLKPVVPWTVGPAKKNETDLDVNLNFSSGLFPLAGFSIGGNDFNPLRINYSHPMILNLTWPNAWEKELVVYRENYTDTDWVYLLLKGQGGLYGGQTYGAHPIHLHGHDFAILSNSFQRYPRGPPLKFDNPPRRDVVLLPTAGWVMIALRTDNPGPWLMHCHIAQHASFGLALQVLERQQNASQLAIDAGAIKQAHSTCERWNAWWSNCTNWYYDANGGQHKGANCVGGENWFSPDSGI